MKKWFSSREAKKITGIILILCVTLGVQIIGFSYFNDRLYRMSLEHAMEQVEELSIFAEKNIQLEINRYIHILKVVETQLDTKSPHTFSKHYRAPPTGASSVRIQNDGAFRPERKRYLFHWRKI